MIQLVPDPIDREFADLVNYYATPAIWERSHALGAADASFQAHSELARRVGQDILRVATEDPRTAAAVLVASLRRDPPRED